MATISRTIAEFARELDAGSGGVANTEFSLLDGVTATTAELNKLAGVTASTAELNALDVSTASGASATTFLRGDATWVAAGSTDAGDLDTGTLLTARLPAKTIIDYSTQVLATSDTSSGTGWNDSGLNASITVASTSDRIFALATGGVQAYANDATTEPITLISLYDVTASTRLMENRCIAFAGSATEWHTSNFACSILITPSQTGTYTIRVDHKALSGSISYVRGTNEQSNASMLTLFYIKG